MSDYINFWGRRFLALVALGENEYVFMLALVCVCEKEQGTDEGYYAW